MPSSAGSDSLIWIAVLSIAKLALHLAGKRRFGEEIVHESIQDRRPPGDSCREQDASGTQDAPGLELRQTMFQTRLLRPPVVVGEDRWIELWICAVVRAPNWRGRPFKSAASL
jgi:hypothetical protein